MNAEEDGRKKKADFTEKADIAKFGYIYKNHLKQMILLFYLGSFICIALMEIN